MRLCQGLGVQTLVRDHARIGGDFLVQLAMADIDAGDVRRAAPQQHISEAAGGGAEIEAGQACRIDAEHVQRAGELQAAARDIRVSGFGPDDRIARKRFGGLGNDLAI